MKLLAVDTATEACSAALYIDGEIIERYEIAPREHSHLILPMLQGLLDEAGCSLSELDHLAFGRGPGSFMGIRIAAGVVQGIGFACDLPVVPVSTLKALSLNAMERTGEDRVLAAIDARMKEVYWAAYVRDGSGRLECELDEAVLPPDSVPMPEAGLWIGAGTGWVTYEDVLTDRAAGMLSSTQGDVYPSASAIAKLAVIEAEQGNTVPVSAAVPVYLRDKVASKPAAKQG